MGRRGIALVLLAGSLVGCGQSTPAGPGTPPPDAASAPATADAGGQVLVLGAYAWRDEMPGVIQDGEPGAQDCDRLCINGTIETESGDAVPDGIAFEEALAIVDGVAHPFDRRELRGTDLGPSQYEFWLGGGPVLEPGSSFDLAVRVRADGRDQWLRAHDVEVETTR